MSLETLFSGAIGSIIAILASFGMFMLKEYNDSKKCIKAIKAEIQCLKNLCSLVFDNVITLDETPLNLCYPLDTDYFTIFNHNSSEIGRISNDKDRELIVAIYIAAKYFLDCLRSNNACLEALEKAKTEEEIEWININLVHMKTKNIIPAYSNLKELLNKFV